MVGLDFLATVEVCKGMNVHDLKMMQSCCSIKEMPPGTQVITQGEEAKELALVVKGEVDLSFKIPNQPDAEPLTLATIPEGRTFGWSALVPPYKYRLSAHVKNGKAELAFISSAELDKLFKDEPQIGYTFMRNLDRVIGKRYAKLLDLMAREQGFDLMES